LMPKAAGVPPEELLEELPDELLLDELLLEDEPLELEDEPPLEEPLLEDELLEPEDELPLDELPPDDELLDDPPLEEDEPGGCRWRCHSSRHSSRSAVVGCSSLCAVAAPAVEIIELPPPLPNAATPNDIARATEIYVTRDIIFSVWKLCAGCCKRFCECAKRLGFRTLPYTDRCV
jgi:hypothetical protein